MSPTAPASERGLELGGRDDGGAAQEAGRVEDAQADEGELGLPGEGQGLGDLGFREEGGAEGGRAHDAGGLEEAGLAAEALSHASGEFGAVEIGVRVPEAPEHLDDAQLREGGGLEGVHEGEEACPPAEGHRLAPLDRAQEIRGGRAPHRRRGIGAGRVGDDGLLDPVGRGQLALELGAFGGGAAYRDRHYPLVAGLLEHAADLDPGEAEALGDGPLDLVVEVVGLRDLIEEPVPLRADAHGYIFSGGALRFGREMSSMVVPMLPSVSR